MRLVVLAIAATAAFRASASCVRRGILFGFQFSKLACSYFSGQASGPRALLRLPLDWDRVSTAAPFAGATTGTYEQSHRNFEAAQREVVPATRRLAVF